MIHNVAGHVSPLSKIEPTIIEITLQMARIRQSITPSRGLLLVNSLIQNMPIQKDLIDWKRKYSNDSLGTVGKGYWDRFIKRNKDKLVSKRGQKYELNRQKWTTYANFVDMYKHTYQEMIEAGVAKKLTEPTWMDADGRICRESEAFGCKVTHHLIHPDMCICGDEVGGNLCIKLDGHVGGELLLTAPGKVPQKKASSKNRRFSMIGLTALTGEPVMCILIIAGKKPNATIEAGVDIRINPVGNPKSRNFLHQNSGPGKYFPGGPVCSFRGKNLPLFIRWNESGSITSEILTQALKTLDHLQVFDRSFGVRPFLLLDGHFSTLEIPFLKYINTPKDHWVCCIGVPYGTALWQVGDSKEQNGSFNIAMSRAKQQLVELKETMGLPPSLNDQDLMPIINQAWQQSFAKVATNKKAISDRGWSPLNRAILRNEDLRATMTRQEAANEAKSSSSIILPAAFCANDQSLSTTSNYSGTTITETDDDCIQSSLNNEQNSMMKLNFSNGTAAFCIDAIVRENDLQLARERIKGEHQRGKTIRQQLESAKRVTSGVVFGCGSTRLGKTVFDICKENQDKKRQKFVEKIRQEEKTYLKDVEVAKEVLRKKPDIQTMTIKELKLICKPLKRKSDGKMPTKKVDLIAKYREWDGRPAPRFEIKDLPLDHCDSDSDNDSILNDADVFQNQTEV